MNATLPCAEARDTHRDQPLRVCFVCSGNTCRSPMAEAVANALAQAPLQSLPEALRSLARPSLEAFSAGLYAQEGDPIATHAVTALEEAGVTPTLGHDYHTHSAHSLTDEEAEGFDLLIGLTRGHAMSLLLRFPGLASRITVLPCDVSDPFGGNVEVYRQCLREITEGVRERLFSGEDA